MVPGYSWPAQSEAAFVARVASGQCSRSWKHIALLTGSPVTALFLTSRQDQKAVLQKVVVVLAMPAAAMSEQDSLPHLRNDSLPHKLRKAPPSSAHTLAHRYGPISLRLSIAAAGHSGTIRPPMSSFRPI